MIRNIVFDMGNVLLDFRTLEAAQAFTETEEDARLLLRETIESAPWISIDRGEDADRAFQEMLRSLPERLHENARQLMERWDEWLFPTPVNGLAVELKEKGYGVYLLSNTSRRFERFSSKAPAIAEMDGMILSWKEGVLKPDPAIYRLLFDRYGLRAEECFFVDDAPLNIECARHLGMEGFCYHGESDALRGELRRWGVEA